MSHAIVVKTCLSSALATMQLQCMLGSALLVKGQVITHKLDKEREDTGPQLFPYISTSNSI